MPEHEQAKRGESHKQSQPTDNPDTQATIALLQEILSALRVNNADGFYEWHYSSVQRFEESVVTKHLMDWIGPLLMEEEFDRIVARELEVSL